MASKFSRAVAMAAPCVLAGFIIGSCSANSDPAGSCTEALTAAEVVMHKAEDALDATSDAISSFVAGDGAGISEANGRLTALTSAVENDVADYNRLAAECRAG